MIVISSQGNIPCHLIESQEPVKLSYICLFAVSYLNLLLIKDPPFIYCITALRDSGIISNIACSVFPLLIAYQCPPYSTHSLFPCLPPSLFLLTTISSPGVFSDFFHKHTILLSLYYSVTSSCLLNFC